MKTLLGLGNTLLLVLNVSTLGTLAYKGRVWEQVPEQTTATESIRETLDLTPSQARAIESERESFLNEWERIEAQLQAAREKLLRTIREGRSEASSLGPVIDDIVRLQGELEAKAVNQLFQERDLLTPEQRELYFSQMEGRMRRGRGYRGGRSGGQRGLQQPESEQQMQPGPGKKGRGKGRRR